MLDFIFEAIGEAVLEGFFNLIGAIFSGSFGVSNDAFDTRGTAPEILSVVPRLPHGAGVLLAKGGQ